MKNDNVGKCGHAQCASGKLCYRKGKPMRTYDEIGAYNYMRALEAIEAYNA